MIHADDAACIGCRTCEIVCALALHHDSNPEKSAIKIIQSETGYEVLVCIQCGACMSACPEGAIYREGSVVKIKRDRCTGCYICVEACPAGVLFVHEEYIEPFKCIQCGNCVESCPVNALSILELES
ncbi:MAG: 4Fe-4S binding protein [Theionarchaea archaeon]|nr:4Fe-4S binding protein [Theionarchaea archaeon]